VADCGEGEYLIDLTHVNRLATNSVCHPTGESNSQVRHITVPPPAHVTDLGVHCHEGYQQALTSQSNSLYPPAR